MTGVLWLIEAILLGCLLVYRYGNLRNVDSAAARTLLIFGAGTAGGIGLTSVLFFLAGVLLDSPMLAMALELAVLAGTAWLVFRAGKREPVERKSWSWVTLALWASLFLALAAATSGMASAWQEIPHGNWDAWATWNLRARYLVSGSGLASRAWSPVLGGVTHIEYPLLVSSFVARCWSFGHSASTAVPAATSYAFFLALVSLAGGAIMALRGTAMGLAAALILSCTPSLLREVPAQYADVPVACYMAGALAFVLLDRPWIAGILGGLAVWTKNEGWLFLAALFIASAVWKRRAIPRMAAGALPAGLLALAFKLSLPKTGAAQLGGSLPTAIHQVGDVNRYAAVFGEFGRGVADMGVGWYHPILPLALVMIAAGVDRQRRRDAAFSGTVAGVLLAGFFAVYIVTGYDLTWQLQTSLPRLLVQAWPLLLVTAFASLSPVRIISAPQAAPSRKAARKSPKESAASRKKGAQ